MGASPDGIVDEEIIIEVKCPYKYRNEILKECLLNNKEYILSFNGDVFVLNKDHVYYHQIQGQLFFSGRKSCILIIWTLKDYVEFNVEKDGAWETNINTLQEFYFSKYVQYMLS